MRIFKRDQCPSNYKPSLIDNDVFERDGARPADIVGFPLPDPSAPPAVKLNELFGAEDKLPDRFRDTLEALREANTLASEVELKKV